MTQFVIGSDRFAHPCEGHEAAWSNFEERVLRAYGDIMDLLGNHNPRCRSESNCKIVMVLFSHATIEKQWAALHDYPHTFRDLIKYSPSSWNIKQIFLPEMLTFLSIIQ